MPESGPGTGCSGAVPGRLRGRSVATGFSSREMENTPQRQLQSVLLWCPSRRWSSGSVSIRPARDCAHGMDSSPGSRRRTGRRRGARRGCPAGQAPPCTRPCGADGDGDEPFRGDRVGAELLSVGGPPSGRGGRVLSPTRRGRRGVRSRTLTGSLISAAGGVRAGGSGSVGVQGSTARLQVSERAPALAVRLRDRPWGPARSRLRSPKRGPSVVPTSVLLRTQRANACHPPRVTAQGGP